MALRQYLHNSRFLGILVCLAILLGITQVISWGNQAKFRYSHKLQITPDPNPCWNQYDLSQLDHTKLYQEALLHMEYTGEEPMILLGPKYFPYEVDEEGNYTITILRDFPENPEDPNNRYLEYGGKKIKDIQAGKLLSISDKTVVFKNENTNKIVVLHLPTFNGNLELLELD